MVNNKTLIANENKIIAMTILSRTLYLFGRLYNYQRDTHKITDGIKKELILLNPPKMIDLKWKEDLQFNKATRLIVVPRKLSVLRKSSGTYCDGNN